ncbi:MAG: hypothetical protein HDT43_00495 [Ruminococcaceae bacterium]|nr:hypothetical protein [Oscillospiraceae bacterium]
MKKRSLCAALALTLMLSGCSSDKVTVNGNAAEVASAGVSIGFPEDWKIFTGDDIYDVTYSRNPDVYASAEELKKDLEENGERYIVYAEAPSEDALALFSSQSLENIVNEDLTVGSLARTTHDSTVFEYRVNGYYTESSLAEETMGGVSGWLSEITIFEEQGSEALSEQREFMFEKDNTVFSFRIFTQGLVNEQAQNISIFAT